MTPTNQQKIQARIGDWLETGGVEGRPARRGQITEVLGRAHHTRYRVRWDEQHESIVYPAGGVEVIPRARILTAG